MDLLEKMLLYYRVLTWQSAAALPKVLALIKFSRVGTAKLFQLLFLMYFTMFSPS